MMSNNPLPQNKLIAWRRHLMVISMFLLGCVVLSHLYFQPIAGLVFLAFMLSFIGFLALAWAEFQRKALALADQEEHQERVQNTLSSVREGGLKVGLKSAFKNPASRTAENGVEMIQGPLHARVFASMEDGSNHGWTFEEPIGSFNGQPLYKIARYLGEAKHFVFDGLTMSSFPNIVSDAYVAFGRVRYKLLTPDLQDPTLSHALNASAVGPQARSAT